MEEAPKYLFQKQEEAERYWTELLWTVSGGSKMEFDSLMGTEVMQFFRILKVYHKKLKAKADGKNIT
jgi:hypothetical protein